MWGLSHKREVMLLESGLGVFDLPESAGFFAPRSLLILTSGEVSM
jgi:hypothetical protein